MCQIQIVIEIIDLCSLDCKLPLLVSSPKPSFYQYLKELYELPKDIGNLPPCLCNAPNNFQVWNQLLKFKPKFLYVYLYRIKAISWILGLVYSSSLLHITEDSSRLPPTLSLLRTAESASILAASRRTLPQVADQGLPREDSKAVDSTACDYHVLEVGRSCLPLLQQCITVYKS